MITATHGTASSVPMRLTVPSLDDAIRLVVEAGGAVTSERRAAPGIGSWVFVVDAAGSERLLWESHLAESVMASRTAPTSLAKVAASVLRPASPSA